MKKQDESAVEKNVRQIAEELVSQAREASAIFTQYSQEEVDSIVYAAAKAGSEHRIELARMAFEETGMGVFEDKVIKNQFSTEYIYNDIKNVKTCRLISDSPETGIMEYAEPLGVVLGIVPVTNPTSTVMYKSLISLKTCNSIIFSLPRNAHKCATEAAKIMYEAALKAGAPDFVIRWTDAPSRDLTHALMTHPNISIILATGGMGLVQAAYSSGTPAIGVGPGNVPVYIEKSANIKSSVNDILMSKTFDNGMICASEQAVVVDREIEKEVVIRFKEMGAYFLNREEIKKVEIIAIDPEKQSMSPRVVGQKPERIAELAGIRIPKDTRVLIASLKGVGKNFPLSREKLSPILGFYVVNSLEEGVKVCTDLMHFGGLGHTASIASENPIAIREFSETINAGRILVNSPSSLGGIGDIYNRFHPSLTLGCGAGGKNITTDNVTVTHLLNIKRVTRRMVDMRSFRIPAEIYYEPGSVDEYFKNDVRDLEAKRAAIICSGSSVRAGVAAKLDTYLRKAGITSMTFSDIQSDPTFDTIEKGAQAIRKFEPDLIIAIGGGSPIDAAKIIWLLYEKPDISLDEISLHFMNIRKRIVPFPKLGKKAKFIAIPTTSGTGSEVTAFSVVTDTKSGLKYPLTSYELTPDVAIIDPNLTLTVPPSVTADTGMDALAHAIEAYVSVVASDYTDPLALKAIQLIFKYLPIAYKDGSDQLAREKLHNASTIAGMAFTNALLGLNHSIAHALGATFHISHGRANALVMIPVIRYNSALPSKFVPYPKYRFPQAKERYAEIADALKLDASTPEKGVLSLINAVADLKAELNMPETIRDTGISRDSFEPRVEEIAMAAFDDQCTGANPSYPMVEDIVRILWETYGKQDE